jgi:hypothetical protein
METNNQFFKRIICPFTNLQFNIKGNPEVIYVLLESSNLVDWTTNKTFQLDSTNASLLIPTNSTDRMFYRLQEW